MKRVRSYRYTAHGLENTYLINVNPEGLLELERVKLHRTIAHWIVREPAQLTPAQFRFLRIGLGFSGKEFAELLGKTPETVSRWEHGTLRLNPCADRLLRLLVVQQWPSPSDPSIIGLFRQIKAKAKTRRLNLSKSLASLSGWIVLT